MIVRLTIEFRRELLWPGAVEIGSGVSRTGGRSVDLEQTSCRDGEIAVTADSKLAIMDDRIRGAIELPDARRAALERGLLKTA